MESEVLAGAIRNAVKAAESAESYKSETYLAILLTELLRGAVPVIQASRAEPAVVTGPRGGSDAKPYSAPELFASMGWKTDLDKVVLAGYFLEHHSGADRFNVNDIRTCLISAKVPSPKNLALALLKSVQRGWLMETPERKDEMKAYLLTQSGERRAQELERKEP